jgi:hypothetical protein
MALLVFTQVAGLQAVALLIYIFLYTDIPQHRSSSSNGAGTTTLSARTPLPATSPGKHHPDGSQTHHSISPPSSNRFRLRTTA